MPRNMHESKPAHRRVIIDHVDEGTYRDFLRWANANRLHAARAFEVAVDIAREVFPEGKENSR